MNMEENNNDGEETKPTETTPTEDKGEGVQPETNRLVDDTNLAAKRLEDANKESREIMKEQAESYSKMKLGGRGERGEQTQKKPEESAGDYAKSVMSNANEA